TSCLPARSAPASTPSATTDLSSSSPSRPDSPLQSLLSGTGLTVGGALLHQAGHVRRHRAVARTVVLCRRRCASCGKSARHEKHRHRSPHVAAPHPLRSSRNRPQLSAATITPRGSRCIVGRSNQLWREGSRTAIAPCGGIRRRILPGRTNAVSLDTEFIMAAIRADDIRQTGYQIGGAVRRHWVLFLVEGIVLVILGILALLAPMIASVAATVFFGWLLLFSGIVGLVATFRARH